MRKYEYSTFKWLAVAIILTICFACFQGFSVDAGDQLSERLGVIRSQKRELGKWADWEKQEAQFLELIKDYNSPAGKGKIYTTIARLYSQEGYRFQSEDPRIPKAIKYCREALKYPLEVTAACEMHGRLTGAMMVRYLNRPEEEFVKIRQEAITYCLTGLKLALDCNAPKEYPMAPGPVGKFDNPGDKELVNKHKQELAAHRKWQFLENLYFQRKALTQRCVTLYSHKPYATDELKLTAEKILKGHEGVANELLGEVEAEIARIEKGSVPDQGVK
jgi:hypothetical protein